MIKMEIIFQFHKGTIRTQGHCGNLHQQPNFNSIKVRLEQCALVCALTCALFQFHKGTIRTTRLTDSL